MNTPAARPRRRTIPASLRKLSPIQRELLRAVWSGDADARDEEIADRFGTTLGALRVERAVALRALRLL